MFKLTWNILSVFFLISLAFQNKEKATRAVHKKIKRHFKCWCLYCVYVSDDWHPRKHCRAHAPALNSLNSQFSILRWNDQAATLISTATSSDCSADGFVRSLHFFWMIRTEKCPFTIPVNQEQQTVQPRPRLLFNIIHSEMQRSWWAQSSAGTSFSDEGFQFANTFST